MAYLIGRCEKFESLALAVERVNKNEEERSKKEEKMSINSFQMEKINMNKQN